MKPCEIPCPKCGSLKIIRRFYLKGDRTDYQFIPRESKYAAPPPPETTPTELAWGNPPRRAICDCFLHFCQDCGWRWETNEMYEDSKT